MGSDDQPAAVLRYASLSVTQLGLVTWRHLLNKGEGYKSPTDWREAHNSFWASESVRPTLENPDCTVNDQTLVVLETFCAKAMVVN